MSWSRAEVMERSLCNCKTLRQDRSYPSRFHVKDGDKEILLSVEKVVWIEASAYHFGLHTDERAYMLRETITDLNSKLTQGSLLELSDLRLSASTGYARFTRRDMARACCTYGWQEAEHEQSGAAKVD